MTATATFFGIPVIVWIAAGLVVSAVGRSLWGNTKIGKALFGEKKGPGE